MDRFLSVTFSMSEWCCSYSLCCSALVSVDEGALQSSSASPWVAVYARTSRCDSVTCFTSPRHCGPHLFKSLFSAANTATFLLPRKLPQKEQSPLCTQQTGQSSVINSCFFFHTHSFTVTFVRLLLKKY